jgi:hypothetical protein
MISKPDGGIQWLLVIGIGHWAMRPTSYCHIRMVIEITSIRLHFLWSSIICLHITREKTACYGQNKIKPCRLLLLSSTILVIVAKNEAESV